MGQRRNAAVLRRNIGPDLMVDFFAADKLLVA
jgi:hypothetical protein